MLMRQLPLGWGQDNPAFRLFFAARFLPEGTPEQTRWFSELQRITTTPEIAVRLRTTAANINVTDLAPRVRAPTLVLHATGDAVVPFEQGRLIAALIPGARFVSLESRNHILLEDEPAWARFTDEVRRFLAEAADARAARTPARGESPVSSSLPPPPPRSAPPPRSTFTLIHARRRIRSPTFSYTTTARHDGHEQIAERVDERRDHADAVRRRAIPAASGCAVAVPFSDIA